MAFHPKFASNGFVYVFYQQGLNRQLVRFTSRDGGKTLDTNSQFIVLKCAPESPHTHRGGRLGFDRHGYLYLSIGDGDAAGLAQDTSYG